MEYIFTERCHLMCPNMCFGISCVINDTLDETRIKNTAEKLAQSHPFLRSTLGFEQKTDKYFYKVSETSKIQLSVMPDEICGMNDSKIIAEYNRQTCFEWDLFQHGFLRLFAWKFKEKMCVLFVFHHLLADGKGGLQLVEQFADCYCTGKSIDFVFEHLITIDDLPVNSRLPLFSRLLVKKLNKSWAKEKNSLAYSEYLSLVNSSLPKEHLNYSFNKIEGQKFAEILEKCRVNNVTVNDYLLAEMFLKNDISKVIVACDLRNTLPHYKAGSLGNFSSAFSINYKANKSGLFGNAKNIHNLVLKKRNNMKDLYLILQFYANLNPQIIDAAFASSKELFNSKTAKFAGDSILGYKNCSGFSITNLGKIESQNIVSACFIPPASSAIKKIQGVLTVNNCLTVCTCERV